MTYVRLTWDDAKADINRRKHGILSEEAVLVFRDPFHLTYQERIVEMKKLAEMPDEDIDTSDIPEMSDEAWRNAVRGKFYRPVKQQITARVDGDVLAWLKAGGQGYQTRLNDILRRAMLEDMKP